MTRPRDRLGPALLGTAVVAAALALAGCSTGQPAGTLADPATAYTAPAATAPAAPVGPAPTPAPTGRQPGVPPTAQPLAEMWPAPEDGINGNSREATRLAYIAAARYATANMYTPTLWHPRPGADPATAYTAPATQMTDAALADYLGRGPASPGAASLLSAPPAITGTWMTPAVGDWFYGAPAYTAGGTPRSVRVTFTLAGTGAYTGPDGTYWTVPISRTVSYDMAPAADTGWRLDGWDGTTRTVTTAPAQVPAPPAYRSTTAPALPPTG